MTHEEIKILLSELDEKMRSLSEEYRDYHEIPMIAYYNGFMSGLNFAKDRIIEMERNKNNNTEKL